jgi:hypothetical protein
MITREFVMAGRATFTVDTPHDYYTFHVWKKRFKGAGRTWWFAYQDTRLGRYIGSIEPHAGRIQLTSKSWIGRDDPLFVTLQTVLDHIWHNTALPGDWSIMHAGTCGACGRALTAPESIERGIGPECWGKRNERRIVRTNHREAA